MLMIVLNPGISVSVLLKDSYSKETLKFCGMFYTKVRKSSIFTISAATDCPFDILMKQ
jgi:hypothetical protein